MTMTIGRDRKVRTSGADSRRHHWAPQLIEGIVLILLGFVAAFVPFGLGIAIFGWLFLIGGTTGLITTLVTRHATGFGWSLASAALAIGIGAAIFAVPEFAIVGLPWLLMTFLVLEGAVSVMLALEHWRELTGRWGWMLASGIVDLSLAAFILIGLPATAAWALGLILAVNLVFGGGALIGMALAAREHAADSKRAERHDTMRAMWPAVLIAASTMTGIIDVLHAQQDENPGRREFLRSCASCHGESGRGDGPVATSLVTPPSDLTRLAAANNGVFPIARVYEVIDGRIERLIHGTREMPVWGDTYMEGMISRTSRDFTSKEMAEAVVRARILSLVEYISTLQKK
jgi:uncharacterized membrane protein HdeD (DUF308 family)